jgi:succinyl-diaminopimelate desuccinylase
MYKGKTLVRLSNRLIEVQSVKDKPKFLSEVLTVVKKELGDFNNRKYNKKGSKSLLFYNGSSIPGRFKIILNAHLDVVSGKPEQFNPKLKGDRLYGRGAQDMKGAAACEVLVFKELAKKADYPLGLQLVTDEEIGGFNGTKYQIEKGVRADFVIAGEPTGLGVNNKAKGIIWVKVKAKGKSAHGAYPWQGDNAIYKINDFLDNLKNKYPLPQKEAWKTTVNVAKITADNKTFNKVPDTAEVWLDVRYIPEDAKTITKNLKKLLPKGVRMEISENEPAQTTDENNSYVKLLRKSVKDVTGKTSPVIVKHGGSDIRHHNDVGCNGVTFGPVGGGLHTDNEWVSIRSLEEYYNVLKHFLLSINN